MEPYDTKTYLLRLFAFACLAWGAPTAASAGTLGDEVPIYRNTFDAEADVNYDNWPDRWEQGVGEHYHHYVDVGIVEAPQTDEGHCLQVELKGGGAQLSTPPIGVLPKFSYRLEYRLKTEGLVHTQVGVIVELLDRHGEVLERVTGPRLRNITDWTKITSFPRIHAQHPNIDRAIIRFDLPRTGRGDLHGKLWIDEIELVRLPSMVVTTGRECNVYDDFSEIKIKCTLSGIRDQNPEIRFQLLDATSRVIPGKTEDRLIAGKLIVEDTRLASDIVGGIGNRPDGYEGSTVWEPDIDDYGFYKVRVMMLSEDRDEAGDRDPDARELDDKEITLVVLPPLPDAPSGEFGWTLPQADYPLSFGLLEELMPRVGVQWIKLPVWFPATDPARGEELVKFAERVSGSGIQVVGIVDEPVRDAEERPRPPLQPNVASFLQTDPSIWQPLYDHVMTRLSLRLRYWQLGGDDDTGFYSYPDLAARIEGVRKNLFRFGQDVKLGLGWRWPTGKQEANWIPPDAKPSWEFEQYSSRTALSADEIDSALATMPKNGTLRWTQVDPEIPSPPIPKSLLDQVPAAQLRHEFRIREFLQQMIVAKIHGTDGIFISNPFTGPDGLMSVDGTPGELLLPWRTTSTLLGGKSYLGSLQFPSGATNHVFMGDDGQVVMVVWNDQEITERISLGDRIKQIDVWGKQCELKRHGQDVELPIGRMPTFFVDLHPEITQFRMALHFTKTRVPSVFSVPHENSVNGKNFFHQGIEVKASLFIPPLVGEGGRFGGKSNEHWDITPRQLQTTVAAGQSFEIPFRFMLKDAAYDLQPIRVDFRVEADRSYEFSVWRDIRVGMGEIEIKMKTRLDESGNLVVEQRMVNFDPTPVNFKCLLYAPPRRRKKTQVVMLDAEGSTKIYQYPDGELLIGKVLTLKAHETDGNRVLIYRFVAER